MATAITNGSAIVINTNNVTIDCNNFKLGGLAGSSGGGHVVEDNRFDGNTYVGVLDAGDAAAVRRNRTFATGG